MLNSDFMYRLEALNAYYYFFQDFSQVQTYVLPSLLPEDQETVYNDENWGMSTVTGLSKWAAAAGDNWRSPSSSDAYKAIVAYFATLNINLNTDQMTLACGNGSMMMQIQATVADRILKAPDLRLNGGISLDSITRS